MHAPTPNHTLFVTLATTPAGRAGAQLLIDSIRAFGGPLSRCPIWVFVPEEPARPRLVPSLPRGARLAGDGIEVLPLALPDAVRDAYFAHKVYACARAEALAGPQVRSLVWLSADTLIIQPPLSFDLGETYDAALRPVHIRNVGSPAGGPVDDFWRAVYDAVGVPGVRTTVASYVDGQRIRAYYNSHTFAVRPALGLLHRWAAHFTSLAGDRAFQGGACRDELHRVFLHQAVLSALLATQIDADRVRLLPPSYSYPYNLHRDVPPDRRARALDDLVCIAYEDRPLDPGVVDDIEIREPLRAWLSAHAPPGEG